MTNAAAKHGISKQFGGCVSSMFLHSVTLQSVLSARVGPDYIPGASRAPGTCATPPPTDGAAQEIFRTEIRSRSAEGSATLGRNSLVSCEASHARRPGIHYSESMLDNVSVSLWSSHVLMQVPWAVGIRPYKDATFTGPQRWASTTCLQRDGASYTMPEWWGLQDPWPELGVIVSAMAAGPIASCGEPQIVALPSLSFDL